MRWKAFVTHISDEFLLDSRAPALRCLERALKAAATVAVPSDAEALRSSLMEVLVKTWTKCEEKGAAVSRRASVIEQHVRVPTPFTQSLWSFVGVCVIKCASVRSTLDGANRSLLL